MGKVSRAKADQHRDDILDAAAELFFEVGLGGVGIPQIMAKVGMTRGGFYRHFESKEMLASLAVARAFDRQLAQMAAVQAEVETDRHAVELFLTKYLSADDNGEVGTPMARMAADIAREAPGSPIRIAFTDGMVRVTKRITELWSGPSDPDERTKAEVLVILSTVVGATLLARATVGEQISVEIMGAVRTAVLDYVAPPPNDETPAD